MSKMEIICDECGNLGVKEKGEVTRSLRMGRRLYCSRSCAAKGGNASRMNKVIYVDCPTCEINFETSTGRRAKRFCSRSCASKGSVTDKRREASAESGRNSKNLISMSEVLKRREAWKYVALEQVLVGRNFEFEFGLGGYVFDLALLDVNTLVEFDGKYHGLMKQKEVDAKKESVAKENGFAVVRKATTTVGVLDPVLIDGL